MSLIQLHFPFDTDFFVLQRVSGTGCLDIVKVVLLQLQGQSGYSSFRLSMLISNFSVRGSVTNLM